MATAEGTVKTKAGIFDFKSLSRKELIERLVLISTVIFCLLLGFLIWLSEGDIVRRPIAYISSFEALGSRNVALNCMSAKNKNTPYCQDKAGESESDWRSVTRHKGGGSAFSLNSK